MPVLPSMLAAVALAASTPAYGAGPWPDAQWWRAYGDPQLDALVARALATSPSLDEAAARLRDAEAGLRATTSEAGLDLGLDAQAGEVKVSYNAGTPRQITPQGFNNFGRIAVGLTRDIDIWGRDRALIAASRQEAAAARADRAEAEVVLTTAVVAAYSDIQARLAEVDAAQASAALRGSVTRLVRRRVDGGEESAGSLALAQAAEASSREVLDESRGRLEAARRTLDRLVGSSAGEGVTPATPAEHPVIPIDPEDLSVGLADRRADLDAARRRVAGAASRLDAARKSRLPTIGLSAALGAESLGLGSLFRAGSDTGRGLLAIHAPLFDNGRSAAGIERAQGELDLARARLRSLEAAALEEAADADIALRTAGLRLADARVGLAAAEDALRLAQRRYEAGADSYLALLAAEEAAISRRRDVAMLQTQALALDARRAGALGGGFIAN